MKKILCLLLLAGIFASCEKNTPLYPEKKFDRVMIYYAFGYNDLSGQMRTNISEMKSGDYLPGANDRNVLLIFEHFTYQSYNYKIPNDSHLIRLTRDGGKEKFDTLMTVSPKTVADAVIFNQVLEKVKKDFDAGSYSLVLTGHGTGWLPQGAFDKEEISPFFGNQPLYSIGQERVIDSGVRTDYFLDIPDMARAIPMHLDNLVLDSCLMGNVESLYELRDCVNYIAASPAQVAGRGFHYETIAKDLLLNNDPQAVCKNFYDKYKNSSSVTSCLVKTSELASVAEACKALYSKYRTQINGVEQYGLQNYMDGNHPWFYDLEHLFIMAGISEEELQPLYDAMARCVTYKDATDTFWGCDKIHYSGLSTSPVQFMSDNLKKYYRTLEWNKFTSQLE